MAQQLPASPSLVWELARVALSTLEKKHSNTILLVNTAPLASQPHWSRCLIILPGVDFIETLYTDHTGFIYDITQMSKCTFIYKPPFKTLRRTTDFKCNN